MLFILATLAFGFFNGFIVVRFLVRRLGKTEGFALGFLWCFVSGFAFGYYWPWPT